MTEKKIATWEDLEAIENAAEIVVDLPATSAKLGRPVQVKIRALTPMEMISVFGFPTDVIAALREKNADAEGYEHAFKEHLQTMDPVDFMKHLRKAVETIMIEPDPSKGDIGKLEADFGVIYAASQGVTMPAGGVAEAAAFPGDGE